MCVGPGLGDSPEKASLLKRLWAEPALEGPPGCCLIMQIYQVGVIFCSGSPTGFVRRIQVLAVGG